jgi:hypothetical protein
LSVPPVRPEDLTASRAWHRRTKAIACFLAGRAAVFAKGRVLGECFATLFAISRPCQYSLSEQRHSQLKRATLSNANFQGSRLGSARAASARPGAASSHVSEPLKLAAAFGLFESV